MPLSADRQLELVPGPRTKPPLRSLSSMDQSGVAVIQRAEHLKSAGVHAPLEIAPSQPFQR